MSYLELFSRVRAFIFDVDGVFTDNELLVMENGELLRKMHVRDGLAVKIALQKGYPIGIITGGKSEGVRIRFSALGIKDIYMGRQDKLDAFEDFLLTYDLDPSDVLYMGDDLPDYPVMRRVGIPVCPQNAIPELFQVSVYISPFKGGDGAVRDVIEQVLKLQEKWAD